MGTLQGLQQIQSEIEGISGNFEKSDGEGAEAEKESLQQAAEKSRHCSG